VTEFARAGNRSRNRSNVGVSLTANIVGMILKQAGLSESVFFCAKQKVVRKPTPSGMGIDDESD
jgi:hypothetical protein